MENNTLNEILKELQKLNDNVKELRKSIEENTKSEKEIYNKVCDIKDYTREIWKRV